MPLCLSNCPFISNGFHIHIYLITQVTLFLFFGQEILLNQIFILLQYLYYKANNNKKKYPSLPLIPHYSFLFLNYMCTVLSSTLGTIHSFLTAVDEETAFLVSLQGENKASSSGGLQ